MQVGSFSKTLSAAARVGHVALRQDWVEGLVLAPGNVFSPTRSAPDFMRFNVAQSQDERLFAFLRQALGRRAR